MQPDVFEGMSVFVSVVEAGSFSSAAQNLGVSVSFVSKQVNRLEERLNARLLQRSTRSLSLTEVGQMYYAKARDIVRSAQEMENNIHSLQQNPVGTIKVSVPLSFGHLHLQSVITDYMRLYPQVELQVDFSSRLVDLAGEGFDVALRLGEPKDSSLISRKVTEFNLVTCAIPEFWQKYPQITHPSQLRQLPAIKYHYQQAPLMMEYFVNGQSLHIDVPAKAQTNHLPQQLELILAGIGFGRLPTFIADDYLNSGRLQAVLQSYEMPVQGIYIVYPHRHHLSAKVRAFVDLVCDAFKKEVGK
ncbi:LysR family transcriptional regulator [Thiomicrorhabdus sp. 6S3-12]|uniref:LysR family transcriptional regulator n=1 Tax=Thiomicrorhabdus sp. 6S3-12 TaxID=2819681 RepID=UPI001AAD7A3B|nr:LysR family transcriptional regulator [Thiomicrorhabdus sp. 6S3-12]MBO1924835.1 LysR family transcriptional regulator [Thiomicrorhabdus sp. 6S3-12]